MVHRCWMQRITELVWAGTEQEKISEDQEQGEDRPGLSPGLLQEL